MPDPSKYNLAFRPSTYWDLPSNAQRVLRHIKGEHRHQWVSYKSQEANLDELEPWLPEEVPIATIRLNSVLSEAISICARPQGAQIRYRIVHEGSSRFRFSPILSPLPLTLGELLALLQTAREVPSSREVRACSRSLPEYYRLLNLYEQWGDADEKDIEDLEAFAWVDSDFYPQLQVWYEEEAYEWKLQATEHLLRDKIACALSFLNLHSLAFPVDRKEWKLALSPIFPRRGSQQPPRNAERAWRRAATPQALLRLLARLGYDDRSTLRLFACWCGRQVEHLLETKEPWHTLLDRAEGVARGTVTWSAMKEAVIDSLRQLRTLVEEPQREDEDLPYDNEEDLKTEAIRLAARLLAMLTIAWAGCNSEWAAAWFASERAAKALSVASGRPVEAVKEEQADQLRSMVGRVPQGAYEKSANLLREELWRVAWAIW